MDAAQAAMRALWPSGGALPAWAGVPADEIVDVIDDAGGRHGAGAAAAFLSGLVDELQRAAERVLVLDRPARDLQPHRRVAVVPAGVHQPRALAREAELVGQVLGIIGLAHDDAVHVAAEGGDGAGTAGLKHGHAARVAPGRLEEVLGHAVRGGPLHGVGNEPFVAAEHFSRVDVRLSDRDGKAELLQVAPDEVGGLELGPALLGAAVQVAAGRHHVIFVGFQHFSLLSQFQKEGS